MESKNRVPLCDECKTTSKDFRKVIELKSSGLSIYLIQNESRSTAPRKPNVTSKSNSFILHNTSEKDIKKQDFINELNQHKTKCSQCRTLIRKVRSLLNELTDIKENEVRAICAYCQRLNPAGTCKRCDQIVNRYVTRKVNQYEECQTKIKSWLKRIGEVLQTLLERDKLCRHNIYHGTSSAEIERLFREMKAPPTAHEQHQPNIEDFPKPFCFNESKGRFQEYSRSGARPECFENDPASPNLIATSCVCKYFTGKKIDGRGSAEILINDQKGKPGPSTLEARPHQRLDRDDWDYRYPDEKKSINRYDSDERDFRYSGKHERDYLYPGKDDREYSYKKEGREYRHPRFSDRDSRSLGRDDREYRSPGRGDRDYRSLSRGDKDYRSEGIDDKDYAAKNSRRPGREERDYRFGEKNDPGSGHPSKDDRHFRYTDSDERDTSDDRHPGGYEKAYLSTSRDDRDFRGSDRKKREYPLSDLEGRSNRYGINERDDLYGKDARDNTYYFPKSKDKDSRRSVKDHKDYSSSGKVEGKEKAKEGDKKIAQEGDRTKEQEKDNAKDSKMKQTGSEKSTDKDNKERRKEEEKVDARDKKEKEKKKDEEEEKVADKSGKDEEPESKQQRKERNKTDTNEKSEGAKDRDKAEVVTGGKDSKGGEKVKAKNVEKAVGKSKTKANVERDTDGSKEKIKKESSGNEKNEGEVSRKKDKKDGKKHMKGTAKTEGDEQEFPKEDTDNVPKESMDKKPKISSEERLFLKMMKDRKDKREKEQAEKKPVEIKLPVFEDLPEIKISEPVIEVEVVSESVIICGDQKPYRATEMIKGADIVPFDSHYKDEKPESNVPLFFTAHPECTSPVIDILLPTESVSSAKVKKSKVAKTELVSSPTGIIKYQLSNRDFVDKGWTVLPTTKVMRRMTIYKMLPVNPNCNWFARHISERQVFYDTGERLATINGDGTGQWYYRNGLVALDYYNSEDPFTNQRYVIYSCGEDIETGKIKDVTILASFDYLGNGVVYDHRGNIRLKYNQSEGMVVDEKIGAPGVWKWHMLNDPPILEPMFLNTRSKHPDPRVEALSPPSDKESKSSKSSQVKSPKSSKSLKTIVGKSRSIMRDEAEEMLAIELENFAKAQAFKMTQKFKPFQITRKIFKINDQFSLKILDQTNIYLMFRDGQTSLKLNLGMKLVSTEIIDSNTSEVVNVPTPYDHLPAKSPSIAHIQSYLMKAKKGNQRIINKRIPLKGNLM